MAFIYLPGEANNLILATSSFSTSSSEDANLPWSNLTNPQGWFAGRFNVAAADDFVHADLGSSKTADFCALFFHNLDAGITVELRRGAAGATLVATLTKDTPAFYGTFGSVADQHWRLKFVGTNSSAIYLGKWALGEIQTLTRVQEYDWEVRYLMEQMNIDPVLPPKNMTKFARRGLDLSFSSRTVAQRNELLAMFRDSAFGAEPCVVVPDDNNPLVVYGRLPGEWSYTNPAAGNFRSSFAIEEDVFPVIVN